MNFSLIDKKQKRSRGKKSNIKGGKVGMKNITIFILTILLVPFLNVAISFAASDAEIQKLKQMIMENRKQNEILMNKIEQMEAEKAANQIKVEEFISEQEQKDLKMDGLMKFFDAIDLGFYIDTTYQYAFDHPNGEDIPLRSLYPEDNEFEIDAFTISISKTPTMDGGVWDLLGFRADILFGEIAPRIASAGLSSDVVDPYQAYLQVLAPVGNGINFYAGKFVTLAGYEVIEAKYNPNITRSILFGFAIPFTHTGIRADYTAGPVTLTAGLNNGWDVVDDNNSDKTIESQIAFSHSGGAITDLWIGVTGYFGRELVSVENDIGETASSNGWRELITAVGTLTFFDKLTFIVDADFGWQQDTVLFVGAPEENVSWWGIAGYIVVAPHPAVTLALRGEYFDDKEGFRTGQRQKLYELTPTISFRPFKGLIAANKYLDNFETRFEFRWDHSDEPFFPNTNGGLDEDQYTLQAQMLYWIDL